MLERVFELREPIKELMESKEQPVDMFNDPIWVSDLGIPSRYYNALKHF